MHSRKHSVPQALRIVDVCIITFFCFNLIFVTCMFNPVQLVYDDAKIETYEEWPPSFVVKLAHWWGKSFDPTLMTRPVWRLTTVWIDLLLFGPFYMFAIYAFVEGRNWIRIPSLLYAATMLTNVTIILSESFYGLTRAPFPFILLAAYAPWIVFPIVVLIRTWKPPPFPDDNSDRSRPPHTDPSPKA